MLSTGTSSTRMSPSLTPVTIVGSQNTFQNASPSLISLRSFAVFLSFSRLLSHTNRAAYSRSFAFCGSIPSSRPRNSGSGTVAQIWLSTWMNASGITDGANGISASAYASCVSPVMSWMKL